MEARENQPVYNQEISETTKNALLRLTWALKCDLPQVLEEIVSYLNHPQIKSTVCRSCKDKSICNSCIFYFKNDPKSQLTTMVHGRAYADYYNN